MLPQTVKRNRYFRLQGKSTPQFAILPLQTPKNKEKISTTTTATIQIAPFPRRKMIPLNQNSQKQQQHILLGSTGNGSRFSSDGKPIKALTTCELIDCSFRYGTCYYTQPESFEDKERINDSLWSEELLEKTSKKIRWVFKKSKILALCFGVLFMF